MSHEQGLRAWTVTADQQSLDRPALPVLIRVPALPALMGPTARPGVRVRTSTSPRPLRRRRLRREVRVAAYAMMLAAPLAFAPLAIRGERSANAPGATRPDSTRGADPSDLAVAHHPPVISISIEPAVGATGSEAEPPVVFPGYLLPDDDPEEPAHAGS